MIYINYINSEYYKMKHLKWCLLLTSKRARLNCNHVFLEFSVKNRYIIIKTLCYSCYLSMSCLYWGHPSWVWYLRTVLIITSSRILPLFLVLSYYLRHVMASATVIVSFTHLFIHMYACACVCAYACACMYVCACLCQSLLWISIR